MTRNILGNSPFFASGDLPGRKDGVISGINEMFHVEHNRTGGAESFLRVFFKR